MKAPTRRDFASLLNELHAAARQKETVDSVNAPALRHDLLAHIERLRDDNKLVFGCDVHEEYMENAGDISCDAVPNHIEDEAEPSLEPALEDLFFLDPGTIARELNLRKMRSIAEIDKARRSFAMRYHPDRMPEKLRERAKLRMQIANMLIDEAKRNMR